MRWVSTIAPPCLESSNADTMIAVDSVLLGYRQVIAQLWQWLQIFIVRLHS